MGMQKKLDAAYQKGLSDGQAMAQDAAMMKGIIKGAQDTWDIIEAMIPQLDGVGPKTKEKIMLAIQAHAKKEKAKIVGWQHFEQATKK